MGQSHSYESIPDNKRFGTKEVVKRDILKQMFMWDFGTDVIGNDYEYFPNDVDGVYVEQIAKYWMSNDLSQKFKAIYDMIFVKTAGYDGDDVEIANKLSIKSVDLAIYLVNMGRVIDLAISYFEETISSSFIAFNESECKDKSDSMSESEILSISVACLYYCKGIWVELSIPYENYTRIEEVTDKSTVWFQKSLEYYNLAKSRLHICNTALFGQKFGKPLTLEKITQLQQIVNPLKHNINPQIYSNEQFESIFAEKRQEILEQLAQAEAEANAAGGWPCAIQ